MQSFSDVSENCESIFSLLASAAADAPDSYAVRDSGGRWTYVETASYSERFAEWLDQHGVRPGDRVLVQAKSTRELVAMFFGCARHGATFVPVNPAMREFQLRGVLRSAQPQAVLVAPDGLEAVAALAPGAYDASQVWREVEETPADGGLTAAATPDDIAALIFTSGSTAEPKAVVTPHRQAIFATRAIQAVLDYRPDDVVFCRFPMSWDYGLYKVLLATVGRSELVLASGESDLLLLPRMRETGVTIVPVVPSLATMIAASAQRDSGPPPPVRMITNTGAALPAATIDALREVFPGVRVVRQFGQTECKRVSIMPPAEDQQRPGSVGRPLPGTEVMILDDEGREVPTGGVGEIVVRGPHVMPGYWRAPELSANTFRVGPDRSGPQLHTGDYGWLDSEGYLYFEGRRDDMFKRKGIRMSTLEIEAAVMDIPEVHAAAVVPPSESRDLALYVVADLTPKRVLWELSRRLEPAKVPGVCRVVEELPLTPHGKNSRADLVTMLEGGSDE
ncbi:AMP-binding protein [Natronosporangium hydrolyticum]|uniref:AMP-binding protein n=1 Tax=Natronosporangium hydrolyticum TaxID=2811111 RepID=A0A895YEK1_9ACTN|nr:AMP-binding protein [Natronosporangium hydrolyticum]QSB16011.1 AMP-binding protein [Natronosporangium hydrolyticum]